MASAERESVNPELQKAIDKGYPEAIVPEETVIWLMGYENEIDDLSLIKLGYRFSPQAIRSMALALSNGIFTQEGYYPPPNPQFRQNVASYAYFNDFINYQEYGQLARGRAIYGNLPQEESGLWIGPGARLISNSVHPTMEEVGVILEARRKENPDLKVVLLDGKFNGVPHPGYFMLFKDIVQELVNEENVAPENLVFVVACATNSYIRSIGDIPFLNSLSRMSLISYMPWPDYVCSSGEFELDKGLKHWIYKTQIIAPDYYSIQEDHFLKESKIIQARAAGAKILTHKRTGMYFPTEVGSTSMTHLEGPEVSSSGLLQGTVGRKTEFSYSNPYAHLFAVKQIRDELYGKRNWFGSKQILLPSDAGNMTLPPEWVIHTH